MAKLEDKKISVIVPIYKVEKYLERCINSIINQTYKNLEIILVDDGSPDNCGKICDDYQKRDSRIKVIHKQNGGLSDARNFGMDVATGDYVGFIDSDDYITEDMYQTLYKIIEKYDADISTCGYYNCNGDEVLPFFDKEEEFSCSAKEFLRLTMEGKKATVMVWCKLYKKELIDKARYRVGKLFEDIYFCIDTIEFINKVAVTTLPKYYYVHRDESIVASSFSEKYMDIVLGYELNYELVKDEFNDLLPQAEFRLLWSYFVVLDKILLCDDFKRIKQYNGVLGFLKRNTVNVIKNPYFNITRRVAAIFLAINVRLYKLLLLYNIKK